MIQPALRSLGLDLDKAAHVAVGAGLLAVSLLLALIMPATASMAVIGSTAAMAMAVNRGCVSAANDDWRRVIRVMGTVSLLLLALSVGCQFATHDHSYAAVRHLWQTYIFSTQVVIVIALRVVQKDRRRADRPRAGS